MTKAERDDLVRLIKQRERVAKTAAEQRSAAMLAEFERQVSALHDFATDEVWAAAAQAAADAAKKCNEEIAARAKELGIPEEFRPRLTYGWARRGENEYQQRRAELRRVAKAEIETVELLARVQIEAQSVEAQTQVVAHGLTSEAAISFLQSMPAIEAMMPPLDVAAIQAKIAESARGRGARPYLLTDD
jgi:replicative superfamily II helicase